MKQANFQAAADHDKKKYLMMKFKIRFIE